MTSPCPPERERLPQLVTTPAALREALSGALSVGLVPTMGYLHAGHAELIRRARRDHPGGAVVVSVFVNPLQFGPGEDLSRYPRDLAGDLRLAGAAGADVVFHPAPEALYPPGFVTRVEVGGLAERLEGAARPGHFGGVATVVLKLLNASGADDAYFGEKDWQQLQVVRRLVADLNHRARVVGVPTVRAGAGEPDAGLALSSRNSYLSDEGRARAAALHRALRAVQSAWSAGERAPVELLRAGGRVLVGEPTLTLESLVLVDAELRPLASVTDIGQTSGGAGEHNAAMPDHPITDQQAASARLLIAAALPGQDGRRVRLIDNLPLLEPAVPGVERP